MQQGRASTIRFNEWICVCAHYEKAVARIGRQVYQGYARGLVTDYGCMEMCKEISQAFADSKKIRADLEEELERDALRGLSVAESEKAEEFMELTPSAKLFRKLKLFTTKLMGKQAVNRGLETYRNQVRDLSRDLGLRALAAFEKEPILKIESHHKLCLLATKLDQDAAMKWEEITGSGNKDGEKGGMGSLSFHELLISFLANFANFSQGTHLGKILMKVFKYDQKEEQKKLTKQFQGTKTAEVLEEQIAEVEEPDLDIGRELETMERDYEITPTDWGLPPRPEVDTWIPDTVGTWSSDIKETAKPTAPPSNTHADQIAPPSSSVAGKPVDSPKPQVLRQRAQPEASKGAEAWVSSGPEKPAVPEPELWTPPPPLTPRVGQSPVSTPVPEPWSPPDVSAPRIGQVAPISIEDSEADWASESPETSFAETEPSRPRLGSPSSAPLTPRPDAAPQLSTPNRADATAKPVAPLPPLPPLPKREPPAQDLTPPPTPLKPAEPSFLSAKTEPAAAGDDPLLRLLRSEDDLLPEFLRERSDDESISDAVPYIPALPTGLDGDSDLNLTIMPFGTAPHKKLPDDDNDEGGEPFIPQMPDA